MKLSTILMIGSWISVFLFAWLVLLDYIEINVVSGGFFIFFVLVALISGSRLTPPRDPTKLN